MLRTTLKAMLARKRRLAMIAVAVSLGVAFLAGTLVLNATINATFDRLFASVYAGTDAVVRQKAAFEGPQNTGQQRGRVDASLVDAVRSVEGVKQAEGIIFGFARLVDKSGAAMGNPANGAPTLGVSWPATPDLNPFVLVDGRAPLASDEIVIDKKSATDAGYVVGDTATVLVKGPPQHLEIVGIAKFGDADSAGGATSVLFTPHAAQLWVAEPGKFDSIGVVAEPGVSQQAVTDRIAQTLPPGTEALTGHQVITETQSDVRKAMSFFTTFMLVFAAVALLVAAFVIFNTFSITVAQRTRESALLRALGASRHQLLFSVVTEALVIGLLASVVGLFGGVGVAALLKAMLAGLGFEMPAGGVVFTLDTALIALATGVSVTVIAAVSPARRAAKVPPITAMRSVVVEDVGYGSKARIAAGIALLAVGVGTLFLGLFGDVGNTLSLVGLGALFTFFGVAALGRTLAVPLSRVLGWPLSKVRGVTGELARENAVRNPKRTAASASALMIGVALVAFITILAASTTASIDATVDRAFTGDFAIDPGTGLSGGIDPGLTAGLKSLPEVKAVTGLRMGSAKVDGSVEFLAAVDPASGFELFDPEPIQGQKADLEAVDSIAVYKAVATRKGLKLGDTIPMEFAETGNKQFRVAMIYGENRPAGDYFLGMPAYTANFPNRLDMQVFVKKAPDATTEEALTAIKSVAKQYPGATVLDQQGYKDAQAAPVNQLLALVYALLGLAILIALLGIGNTLALSIFERTHELGLLRAVGMTRSQLRSTIRWESVIIAMQGTVLGLAIGWFFGWSLVRALSDEGIDQFSAPIVSLVIVVLLGWAAGVVAAVLPGRRAAKLDVLKAVVTE